MKSFAILSLASGNVLNFYDTQPEASEAMRRIIASEPESEVALVEFDERGHPIR